MDMSTPEPSSTSSNPLKRDRSPDDNGFRHDDSTSEVPDLPRLSGDVLLETFTHKSLRVACNARYRDNERLTMLGRDVLDMITTQLLYFRSPRLKVDQIMMHKAMLLTDDTIDIWAKLYRLRNELRCDPSFVHTLESREQGRALFHAYLGAVFDQRGIKTVQEWIGALLRLSTNVFNDNPVTELGPGGATSSNTSGSTGIQQPAKRPKVEETPVSLSSPPPPPPPGGPPGYYASSSPYGHTPMSHYNPYSVQPVPPPGPPPPPPPSPPRLPPPNPLAPAQPNLAFLPLFNQTAIQRGLTVQYSAAFDGPAHAGTWVVSCTVNGIEKGKGKGSSKQLAKEQAARDAYHAMGWAPRKF
ncbi:hypothetical protein CONPUDRAFT_86818 [Coniophora puteana RWD-64-598 SS2]|uniref:Uncharacterized protein n=1 Tax=Coniophora puteana (strain RWD-64-598) TaxID=741705 RepID=A0A5M3N619_CONPW|nr:uncharacterized protein CONPUDRAFT_86818 [Coniophora puteana RWD-64-598 SS2]EIW86880.1 hypothetical protein CONPUDRAFT_86818 [Coniophora puteana RWD-64-598 SS2]